MANPLQEPKIALPGAEYFALAQGRDIGIGPRLASFASSTLSTVPISGVAGATISITLDPNFGYSSGFYLVRAYALFVPNDTTGLLQLVGARMGLGQPPTNIFLDMGIPLQTFNAPLGPLVAIFERDALVVNSDLGPNWPQNTPLSMDYQVSVKNVDGAATHQFLITGVAVWHLLRGFVQ